jgi:hypothetical protein
MMVVCRDSVPSWRKLCKKTGSLRTLLVSVTVRSRYSTLMEQLWLNHDSKGKLYELVTRSRPTRHFSIFGATCKRRFVDFRVWIFKLVSFIFRIPVTSFFSFSWHLDHPANVARLCSGTHHFQMSRNSEIADGTGQLKMLLHQGHKESIIKSMCLDTRMVNVKHVWNSFRSPVLIATFEKGNE